MISSHIGPEIVWETENDLERSDMTQRSPTLSYQRARVAHVCVLLPCGYIKMTAFWHIASCTYVEVYRRFRGVYCLHRRGNSSMNHPESEPKFTYYYVMPRAYTIPCLRWWSSGKLNRAVVWLCVSILEERTCVKGSNRILLPIRVPVSPSDTRLILLISGGLTPTGHVISNFINKNKSVALEALTNLVYFW
jgi:hypothetical protein